MKHPTPAEVKPSGDGVTATSSWQVALTYLYRALIYRDDVGSDATSAATSAAVRRRKRKPGSATRRVVERCFCADTANDQTLLYPRTKVLRLFPRPHSLSSPVDTGAAPARAALLRRPQEG